MSVTINSLSSLGATDLYFAVVTGTPVNGTSGTLAGIAGPGSKCYDDATGRQYITSSAKSSPTWELIVNSPNGILESSLAAASLTGLNELRTAKCQYDFSVDGGAVGAILPVSGATLPSKAIILGGVVDVVTTITGGGGATIALGTSAGSSATSLKAATAIASYTGVALALVPVFTAATIVKLTASGAIQITVGTAALTAGKFNVILAFMVGD